MFLSQRICCAICYGYGGSIQCLHVCLLKAHAHLHPGTFQAFYKVHVLVLAGRGGGGLTQKRGPPSHLAGMCT